MLMDATLQFSAAQALTSTTVASTNSVDLGIANDPGIGLYGSLDFWIQITTAFVTAGSATLQVQVQGAPDNGSGAAGSFTTITETDALAASVLLINTTIPISLTHRARGMATYRFLQLNYVIGTSTFSAGAVSSWLVFNRDTGGTMGQYPNNYTVGS